MNAVVRRCPNCGVEHDPDHLGACEVCGTELRYWCQRHGRDVGWLNGPECPVCVREEAERLRRPPPPPRPVVPPSAPPVSGAPRRHGRRAEPAEGAEIRPPGAGSVEVATRAIRAVAAVVRSVVTWAFLGALVGMAYGILVGRPALWLAFFGLYNGGIIGLLVGFFSALRILFSRDPPR